jgi:hypothetical protein
MDCRCDDFNSDSEVGEPHRRDAEIRGDFAENGARETHFARVCQVHSGLAGISESGFYQVTSERDFN